MLLSAEIEERRSMVILPWVTSTFALTVMFNDGTLTWMIPCIISGLTVIIIIIHVLNKV